MERPSLREPPVMISNDRIAFLLRPNSGSHQFDESLEGSNGIVAWPHSVLSKQPHLQHTRTMQAIAKAN